MKFLADQDAPINCESDCLSAPPRMKPCPQTVGRARVICYTPIDERHRFTGGCKQLVAGKVMGAMAGLAICRCEAENAYYLFGCDADWQAATDTWHLSLDDAKEQAEFEYEGVRKTWIERESLGQRSGDDEQR